MPISQNHIRKEEKIKPSKLLKYHFEYSKCYKNLIFFDKNKLIVLFCILKSASNLNGNLNCSKELEHYAS